MLRITTMFTGAPAAFAALARSVGHCVRILCLIGFAPGVTHAQTGANVMLVVNERVPASEQIGQYYARARAVPQDNVVRIGVEPADEIGRTAYERDIEAPLAVALARRAIQDQILYVVLTKGVPLRVAGTGERQGTVASVDSELTILYRKLAGHRISLSGRIPNPYYLGQGGVAEAVPFTHERQDIFLVSRLDGYTVEDVTSLIDRGLHPRTDGKIVLDEKGTLADPGGDAWLQATAKTLKARGWSDDKIVHDATRKVVSAVPSVLGYYSWGSNDPANRARRLELGFIPGAIAATFVSTDARTFEEPPEGWNIGSWEDPQTHFAGSPQSLTGDLIREGATGVAGHVAEPYLDAAIRPQILFPAYLAGFSVVEAFYLAMPFLSWQTVVVGDPLCAPFRTQALAASQVAPALDVETEWPLHFARRRFDRARNESASASAVKLSIRAEARMARGDTAGARSALEQAVELDANFTAARMALGSLYEIAGDRDRAIEAYRRIVERNPAHAVALNNLAYAVAVHQKSPREALPLAQKAYAVSRGNPMVTDTLGWIHHLLGEHAQAARFLEEAVRGAPDNIEVLLHASAVEFQLGRADSARASLERAIALDPGVALREEAIALRKALDR